jgi:hypothetical protein
MGKSRNRQTTMTQGIDPASQRYVGQMRQQAMQGVGAATGTPGQFFLGSDAAGSIQDHMNPYIQGVIDPMRAEFDLLRGQANVDVNQQAVGAGAFGGSRHGIAAGQRLGEIDRAQAGQVAQLMHGGFQQAQQAREHERQLLERQAMEPLFRQQQALQFMQGGLGPTGQTVTQTMPGQSIFGSAAGGAMTGFGIGGPKGALIGGGLGLLSGLFG